MGRWYIVHRTWVSPKIEKKIGHPLWTFRPDHMVRRIPNDKILHHMVLTRVPKNRYTNSVLGNFCSHYFYGGPLDRANAYRAVVTGAGGVQGTHSPPPRNFGVQKREFKNK